MLDLYSGVVVGWSMSPRQDRQLVVQAVLMAVWQRPARTPVILHSDRGCQFTSEEYQQFLAAHQVTCSMSAVGSCADNAAAESFFGVLKRERVNRQQYRTRAEARADIFDYIERWHNPRQRRRLAIAATGGKTLNSAVRGNGVEPLVARTLTGLRKTTLPDHRIRLEAHDRLVSLYGGTPRPSEIPPLPPKGLTVIIQKEGEAEKHEPLNLMPKTKIEPQGQANPRPLPYRITRESED